MVEKHILEANIAEADQRIAASDLVLHCLLMSH